MKPNRLSIPIAIFFLAGCASMDKNECLTAQWQTIGFEDGVEGKNISSLSEYRKDCAKHGVTPVLADYLKGHTEGSKLFCTNTNGFEQGNNGRGYHRSCPEELEAEFLSGYRKGQELYSLRRIVNSAQNDLDRAQHRIDRLYEIIAEKSELMIADGLVRDERARYREEIEQHRYEQFELQEQIPFLLENVEQAIENYESAERRLSAYLN